MAVGIGGDADKVRLKPRQSLVEVRRDRIALQIVGQVGGRTVDQPHDLEFRVVVIGQRMAAPHVAKACDKGSDHLTAPAVMPRISWREKMR